MNAETVVLHELGHCVFGLDHINRPWNFATGQPPYAEMSLTRSASVVATTGAIESGMDVHDVGMGPELILGSSDDIHWEVVGSDRADSISWFRKADNNPFVVDGTVIDLSTFGRSVTSSLPAGHRWGASANYFLGDSLGFADTQSVMYSEITGDYKTKTLSADDVNMVEMAMAGANFTNDGGTGDDYTVAITVVSCTQNPDIVIDFADQTAPGFCLNDGVDYSFSPVATQAHLSIQGLAGQSLSITLSDALDWDFESIDLRVVKSDSGVTVDPGSELIYTLDVVNDGTIDATGVTLFDEVPVGTTFNAALSDVGWSCNDLDPPGSLCQLDLGTITDGSSIQSILFVVNVDSPATVSEVENEAVVVDDGASGSDLDPFNNVAVELTPVNVPCNGTEDLVLTSPSGETTVTHEACNSITASFIITAGRDVTFKARNLIALRDGFSVEAGAVFKAENDPLAGQNPP